MVIKVLKRRTWYVIFTNLIMIIVTLLMSIDVSAECVFPNQGTTSFFGIYEEPYPGPDPSPNPGTDTDPNNRNFVEEENSHLENSKDNLSEKEFPQTGEKVQSFLLSGLSMVALSFLVMAMKIRKREK